MKIKNLIIALILTTITGCGLAPKYEVFKPTSKMTLISGTYKRGANVTEPRPVEGKYLKVQHGGVIIIPSGAGFYINTTVKKSPKKDLYIVIEYENPNDKSKPLTNDQKFLKTSKGFYFTSPSVINGIRGYESYEINVKIYDSKKKDRLLDQFTQKFRSYVDTTTNQILIKTGMSS